MTQVAIPSLPYGGKLTRLGVTVQENEFGLRVVVPPLRSWRQLPKGYWIGFCVLCVLAVMPLVMESRAGGVGSDVLIPLSIYGGSALLVAGFALRLFWRRIVIDVTQRELIVTLVGIAGLGRCMAWPRLAVSEVKVNVSNGKLLVRCPSTEMADFWLGPDREVLEEVVDCVRRAVFASEYAPATGGVFPEVLRTTRKQAAWMLAIMIAAGFVLLGLLLIVMGIAGGAVLLIIALLSVIPIAGMIHGTQEKKFFT